MAQGKPYRYGLIAAGLCVAAAGLFVMTQERPHIYGTMCALGVLMIFLGSVWSICQCYPKVILAPRIQESSLEDVVCTAAGAAHERLAGAPPALSGHGPRGGGGGTLLLQAAKNQHHSCPTLHLA